MMCKADINPRGCQVRNLEGGGMVPERVETQYKKVQTVYGNLESCVGLGKRFIDSHTHLWRSSLKKVKEGNMERTKAVLVLFSISEVKFSWEDNRIEIEPIPCIG